MLKRRKIDTDFEDWQDAASDVEVDESKDEIDRYIEFRFSDEQTNYSFVVDMEDIFDIGKFWCSSTIKELFQILSRVAIGILSIPASSASSERVFSTAGDLKSDELSCRAVRLML